MADVAVLIPTYKPGSYLSRCLKSLESQTLSFDKFRVYVALNGPRLPFENYVQKQLQECSFEFVYTFLDQVGVSHARNTLIEMSTEPYVVFIDDDDVVSENYLRELLYNCSVKDMAISDVRTFKIDLNSLDHNYLSHAFLGINKAENSKFKTRKYFSSPWAKMLHRRMIGETRFDINLSMGEDSLFMAEISSRIETINKAYGDACYYVYEREGSASRSSVDRVQEVKRLLYLIKTYSKMLLLPAYNRIFVLTRIVATLKHCRRLL